MQNLWRKYPQVLEKSRCRCNLYMTGGLKSICKFKEKQVADIMDWKRASTTANIKELQIYQLSKEYLRKRITETCRYITKQEKDYAIQRIGVGLARRSWAGVHSLFFLGGRRELNRTQRILSDDIYANEFSGIEDVKFLQEASARHWKSTLRMHNFDVKHPQVIENVGCRCKIWEGSIRKP